MPFKRGQRHRAGGVPAGRLGRWPDTKESSANPTPLPELVAPFSLEPGDTGPATCQREWSLAKSKGSSEARVMGFRSPLRH